MTAPQTRKVCMHTGTIADCPETDRLREKCTNACHERDDAVDQVRILTAAMDGLGKFVGAYQMERDEERERADDAEAKCDRYLATIDELEAEVRELRGKLMAVAGERDSANAAASWERGGR